jgi:exodeoxyribonuclease VII small subunit
MSKRNKTNEWSIPEDASYETLVGLLEQSVERLESGELTLEASVREYEYGMELIARCNELLDRAELRVSELAERVSGAVEDDEFDE